MGRGGAAADAMVSHHLHMTKGPTKTYPIRMLHRPKCATLLAESGSKVINMCLVDSSILINWMSPFPVSRVSGVLFHFYFYFLIEILC